MPSISLYWLRLLASMLILLGGCHPVRSVSPKVPTTLRMSAPIFLEPISKTQKTVFLQVCNPVAGKSLDLKAPLTTALQKKGYEVVSAPTEAHYIIQIQLLQLGYSDPEFRQHHLSLGFGATLNTPPVHPAKLTDRTYKKSLAYSAMVDVQIDERMGKSMAIQEKSTTKRKKKKTGFQEIISTEKIEWKRYQTRLIQELYKSNLTFKKAAPFLIQELTATITGIL